MAFCTAQKSMSSPGDLRRAIGTGGLEHRNMNRRRTYTVLESLGLRSSNNGGEAFYEEACARMLSHVQTSPVLRIPSMRKEGIEKNLVTYLPSSHVRLCWGSDCAEES
mmetsp:Transcript_39473/g.92329  ORF Transcript_39473/g.92329 Transcript_39473/m.92329 type:complete len:108 (+) Transcript_39473:1070-1393(+)